MTPARIATFAAAMSPRLKRGSRILEIGSGDGELAAALRARGHHVVALEPKAPPESEALRERFEDFHAPKHYFDAVAMQLVLHHADRLDAFLDKVRFTLQEDGLLAVDDYGWERADSEAEAQWRKERSALHTSKAMLAALRTRFRQQQYFSHAYFEDGTGNDRIAFTFLGTPARGWPVLIGGSEARPIVLAEYNPEWRMRFEMERRRIVSALGSRARGIEHVGSTAVPGLAAKPVIDILLAVDDPLDDELRAALERAGYVLRVEEPEHRMLRTPQRDVHVHLWACECPEIERLLRFRNRLRDDAGERALYERAKRELARREWRDTNDYARAKDRIVAEILSRAD